MYRINFIEKLLFQETTFYNAWYLSCFYKLFYESFSLASAYKVTSHSVSNPFVELKLLIKHSAVFQNFVGKSVWIFSLLNIYTLNIKTQSPVIYLIEIARTKKKIKIDNINQKINLTKILTINKATF